MYVVELEFLQNWVLVLLMHPLFRAAADQQEEHQTIFTVLQHHSQVMRGLETTPAIIIYSSIKMMIHIFPGWLDKAKQRFSSVTNYLQHLPPHYKPSKQKQLLQDRKQEELGLTLEEFYVFIWLLPLILTMMVAIAADLLLCCGQNQSCFVLVKRGAINKHHLCERSPNLPRLSGK